MEYIHRVISRSSAGGRLPADDAGETHRTHIHPVPLVVIAAPEFPRQFGYSVHRIGVHHGILGSEVQPRMGAERPYRGGPEYLGDFAVARQVEYQKQRIHIQPPGVHRLFLSDGRKHGRQVVHIGNAVLLHDPLERRSVQRIECPERRFQQSVRRHPDIGGQYIFRPVLPGQPSDQFRAYLSQASYNQSFLTHNPVLFGLLYHMEQR